MNDQHELQPSQQVDHMDTIITELRDINKVLGEIKITLGDLSKSISGINATDDKALTVLTSIADSLSKIATQMSPPPITGIEVVPGKPTTH